MSPGNHTCRSVRHPVRGKPIVSVLEMVFAVLRQQRVVVSRFRDDRHRSDAARKSFRRCGCVAAGNVDDPRRVVSAAAASWRLGQTFNGIR